jgi:hypothetical protein
MRPKIVILILVVAFGLLGSMVVLKRVMGRHNGDAGGQTPAVEARVESPPGATNVQDVQDVQVVQVNSNSSNSAAISEQLRAAVIEKEVEQIQDLQGQADGPNNPMIISALLAKLSHPEAKVRQAVLEAVKQMDDTNAVPGLEQAAESIKDPREKVAMLDTIEYLKLPSATANVPPELATNNFDISSISTNVQVNPAFLKGNKNGRLRNNGQQTVPPNTPADQPQ